jgi:deoxyribodipyrimidine photo-lyase
MGHGAGGRSDTVVVWFRRDLRLADHPALTEAVDRARRVVPLFVLDGHLLSQAAPARAWFLRGSLAELDASLRARGSGLLVHSGSPAEVVTDVARRYDAAVVWATRDVTPYSHRRDADVAAALARDGRKLKLRAGLLLAEPEAVSTAAGAPYGVFTPFWRSLQGLPRRPLLPAPDEIPSPPAVRQGSADLAPGPSPSPGLPRPGESAALERLAEWTRSGLAAYGSDRDGLAGEATSRLGADLHLGTLSPLQVEAAALGSGVDATAFTRQLGWREFYHHHLFHRRGQRQVPSAPLMAAFRRESDDPVGVQAWRDGRTGVPVVDAGMRQLAATGWMSNRARLVVASFLTRHLLMDYRIGERHFMRHLLDGDVANNRGGWQWTAGVGADAQPWFRIFNPVRQGRRFDPDGTWVRHWVPELEGLDDRHVHAPWEAPEPPSGYPAPIVDLAAGRERALAAFKAATS